MRVNCPVPQNWSWSWIPFPNRLIITLLGRISRRLWILLSTLQSKKKIKKVQKPILLNKSCKIMDSMEKRNLRLSLSFQTHFQTSRNQLEEMILVTIKTSYLMTHSPKKGSMNARRNFLELSLANSLFC